MLSKYKVKGPFYRYCEKEKKIVDNLKSQLYSESQYTWECIAFLTVNDLFLKSVAMNVESVQAMINLCKQMKKLEVNLFTEISHRFEVHAFKFNMP